MSDWKGGRPTPETPADSDPAPTPETNGWRQWIEGQAAGLETLFGRTGKPDTVVLETLRIYDREWFPSEGDDPHIWKAEPTTAVVEAPVYRDFTLYSRFYPRMVLAAYIKVRVRLVLTYSNPDARFEKVFMMYEPTGETREEEDFTIYRWELTSWENDIHGVKVKIQTDELPDNEFIVPHQKDDLGSPRDEPPEDMLQPRPPKGRPYYASLTNGWRVGISALLDAPEVAWAKVAGKKGKVAVKKGGGKSASRRE